jgi:hypothetical protein
MRYLRPYNEMKQVRTIAKQFSKEYDEINSMLFEVEDYIMDIFIDLIHDGYEVETYVYTDISDNHISVKISNRKKFELKDIEDTLLHLDSYLKSVKMVSHLLDFIDTDKHTSQVKKDTYMDRETGEYKLYSFFFRLYPKKVKEIRNKIDKIRKKGLKTYNESVDLDQLRKEIEELELEIWKYSLGDSLHPLIYLLLSFF